MNATKAAGAARESGDPHVADQLGGKIGNFATTTTVEIQILHLARRGLPRDRARLIAGMHFGEARS